VDLKWDERELVVSVAQDSLTGEVRMVAWMNRAALQATEDRGFATFFSRSRGELWEKGATSGHRLCVEDVLADCDGDSLLLSVLPEGPTCHTGRPSCFYRALDGSERRGLPFLFHLETVIAERASSCAEKSYTRSLLEAGNEKIGAKVLEEAGEFGRAIADESDERVISEAADVLYHLMVGLRSRSVALREVVAELARRSGVSGHVEKASRSGGGSGPRQV